MRLGTVDLSVVLLSGLNFVTTSSTFKYVSDKDGKRAMSLSTVAPVKGLFEWKKRREIV